MLLTIRMPAMKRLALLGLIALVTASCGQSNDVATIHVITPPAKASQFTEDLATIAIRKGLSPNLGHSTDDRGHTSWIIEANGRWVRLWGTNVPLSGQENAAQCGRYDEGHPDPGQYVVTIDRIVPMIARHTPRALILDISKELEASGYDVRSSPIVCSSLSKADSASRE